MGRGGGEGREEGREELLKVTADVVFGCCPLEPLLAPKALAPLSAGLDVLVRTLVLGLGVRVEGRVCMGEGSGLQW